MTLTVCISTHNHAPYIEQAVRSALCADEVLIYDDASTDGTSEKLTGNVYRSEKPCGSPVDALNWGIDNASCDWVLNLSGDDFLIPGAVERIKPHLKGDWMYGDLYVANENGAVVGFWNYKDIDPSNAHAYLRETRMLPVPMQAFRVAWLREKGLRWRTWESTTFGEDVRTCLDWLEAKPAITYAGEPFIVYRRHAGQASQDDAERQKYLLELDQYLKGDSHDSEPNRLRV